MRKMRLTTFLRDHLGKRNPWFWKEEQIHRWLDKGARILYYNPETNRLNRLIRKNGKLFFRAAFEGADKYDVVPLSNSKIKQCFPVYLMGGKICPIKKLPRYTIFALYGGGQTFSKIKDGLYLDNSNGKEMLFDDKEYVIQIKDEIVFTEVLSNGEEEERQILLDNKTYYKYL